MCGEAERQGVIRRKRERGEEEEGESQGAGREGVWGGREKGGEEDGERQSTFHQPGQN